MPTQKDQAQEQVLETDEQSVTPVEEGQSNDEPVKQEEETQVAPPENQEEKKPDNWEKRYKDSQNEFNRKWKPIADKANYVATLAGFDTIEELYEEVRKAEIEKQRQQETSAPEPQTQQSKNQKEETSKPDDDVKTELDKVKDYIAKEERQKIDAEFESFYASIKSPEKREEVKQGEPKLISVANSLWRIKDGKEFKYSRLRDALHDAYILLHKSDFMEEEKLKAFAEALQDKDATQSVFGSSTRNKVEAKPDSKLTAEQRRVYEKFKAKGVFKNEQEYLNNL